MMLAAWTVVIVAAGLMVDQLMTRSPRVIEERLVGRTEHRRSIAESIGHRLRRTCGRPGDSTKDILAGRSLLLCTVLAPVSFRLVFASLVLLHIRSVLARRRTARVRNAAIESGVAQAIELFLVALRSGHNMTAAVDHVAHWVGGEVGEAFRWCLRQVATGRTLSDALESIPDRLGPTARPLIGALVANDRYGAPIVANLTLLAAESRSRRRRRAEVEARRLPVLLLFPLVVCVLPAFLSLTVVPVVVDSFAGLELFASP